MDTLERITAHPSSAIRVGRAPIELAIVNIFDFTMNLQRYDIVSICGVVAIGGAAGQGREGHGNKGLLLLVMHYLADVGAAVSQFSAKQIHSCVSCSDDAERESANKRGAMVAIVGDRFMR